MTDFSASFKKGLDAAQIAQKNHAEIRSVFDALNNQLARESNGRIAVEIRKVKGSGTSIKEIFRTLNAHDAIVAYNPNDPQSTVEELAEWSEDRIGYPCRIKFGLKQTSFEDKEALEAGLADLLEDPIVGETLYHLMQIDNRVAQ